MNDDREIRPALTPEEWASGEVGHPADQWCVQLDHGIVDVHLTDGRRHALAAMLLHAQPFAFTWDDVDDIRRSVAFAQEAAEAACGNALKHQACDECQEAVDRYKARLDSIADRIAALLPPREP